MRTRVLIDSRHIATKSGGAFSYDVKFSDIDVPIIKSVTKVELKNLIFPKVSGEPYVLMKLVGLDTNLYCSGSSSTLNDCFCVVFFDNSSMAPGTFKTMKGGDLSIMEIEFDGQRPSFHNLRVEFLRGDCSVVRSSDTGGVEDHAFLLEFSH